MSVSRVLDVFDELVDAKIPLSADAFSQRLKIPKASIFRLLNALLVRGYLRKSNGKYLLGLRLLTLGSAVADQIDLREQARPAMHTLLDECGETVMLAIWDSGAMLHIDKCESSEAMRIFAAPGLRRKHLYASAHGKVVLAYTPEKEWPVYARRKKLESLTPKTITDKERLKIELALVRKRCWAMDDEERRLGVRRFAAPVFDRNDAFAAVIGFAGPTVRLSLSRKRQYAGMVIKAAASVTEALEGEYPL